MQHLCGGHNNHSQCDIYSGARFVPEKAWHKTITYINAPAVGVIFQERIAAMDVKELYLKVLSFPIWIKIVIGALLLVFWLLGQLAFKNSMVKIQESGAYASVSAIVVQSKEVQDVVGNDIAMSLVTADPKKGF